MEMDCLFHLVSIFLDDYDHVQLIGFCLSQNPSHGLFLASFTLMALDIFALNTAEMWIISMGFYPILLYINPYLESAGENCAVGMPEMGPSLQRRLREPPLCLGTASSAVGGSGAGAVRVLHRRPQWHR